MLVGAVTIAVLLVGLVVVFNSALFTETVDQESAIQASGDATEFMTGTERDLRSLLLRVNHAREYDSDAAVNASISENVTAYNLVLTESYADASTTVVNVSVDADEGENGRRIVQNEEDEFTQPTTGSETWTPVGSPTTSRAAVGRLVVNLNVSELSTTEEFSVRLTNASGAFYEASFQRNATGTVLVRTNVSSNHAANGTVKCRSVGGRLLVDVMAGEVFGRSCGFNASSFVEGPYQVQFRNGDAASGEYGVVTREESAVDPQVAPCSPVATSPGPCSSPIVWSTNVTLNYRSSQVSVERNTTLEVYNGTE